MLREMTPYETLKNDIESPLYPHMAEWARRKFTHYSKISKKYGLTFNEAYYMENSKASMISKKTLQKLRDGGHSEKLTEIEERALREEIEGEYAFELERGN